MFIQDRLSLNPNPIRNNFLREIFVSQNRLPRDQRVDLPEIQESFRVSFSEEALAASTEGARDVMQKARPSDEGGAAELKLRSYMAIAAL
jgi:hypothetical protein